MTFDRPSNCTRMMMRMPMSMVMAMPGPGSCLFAWRKEI